MTDREKAIVMAYTGITMLTGEKLKIFHEYIQKILGRPVWTHELADKLVWNEIKEKSKNDFLEICKTEERPQGEWISTERGYECSKCGTLHVDDYPFCHMCGADMGGDGE